MGHFQLAQNRQDQTVQNTQISLTPQEPRRQEITYDYTDLVYEYPEYDVEDNQYYLFDEDKEQDFRNIKIESRVRFHLKDNAELSSDLQKYFINPSLLRFSNNYQCDCQCHY